MKDIAGLLLQAARIQMEGGEQLVITMHLSTTANLPQCLITGIRIFPMRMTRHHEVETVVGVKGIRIGQMSLWILLVTTIINHPFLGAAHLLHAQQLLFMMKEVMNMKRIGQNIDSLLHVALY